jgi:hypothetical protein
LAEVEVGVGPSHSDLPHRIGSSAEPSDSNYFTLKMLDMQLGCPVAGALIVPSVSSNGQTIP